MLKRAYFCKEELEKLYRDSFDDSRLKYYVFCPLKEYSFTIDENEYNNIQMVSVVNNKVIGFLSASVDIYHFLIDSINIICFFEKSGGVFLKDVKNFISYLLDERGFRKIKFRVAVGNPSERIYDRAIKYFNRISYPSQIVGIFTKDIRLPDGKYYDVKEYEIMKREEIF